MPYMLLTLSQVIESTGSLVYP